MTLYFYCWDVFPPLKGDNRLNLKNFYEKNFSLLKKLPFLTFIENPLRRIFLNDHTVSFSNDKETNVKKIGGHQVSFQVIGVRSSKEGLNNHQVSLPW